MGILNVTPDSFSDGGRFFAADQAVAHAERLVREGAHILDIGGESTRPGAAPVPAEEELRRVLPVVKKLARRFPKLPLSIDTSKSSVARACLDAGASIINDVSALRFDGQMAAVAKAAGATVILMHMQGEPRTMQAHPAYKNVVRDIKTFFRERMDFAVRQGLERAQLWLDPGLGFGKTTAHNLAILRGLPDLLRLGLPLVVGASRKSFIGRILGSESAPLPAGERGSGSLAVDLWAAESGVHVLRVHDVAATAEAWKVWRALSGKK
jgi:dihydropteroate synthase